MIITWILEMQRLTKPSYSSDTPCGHHLYLLNKSYVTCYVIHYEKYDPILPTL